MDGTAKRSAAIVLTHNLEVLDNDDKRRTPFTSVSREALAGLFGGDVLGAGAVMPLYATEVGLVGPDGTVARQDTSEVDRIENGRLILRDARAAIEQSDRGRLRKLCWWFPFVRRMPEVHRFLDSLPRVEAEQIAGVRRGVGRRPRSAEQIGLIATLNMLHETGMSVAEAADLVAARAHVSAEHLQNLHAELGELVRCLSGYQVPESDVPCHRWGDDPTDEFNVFVIP